MVVLPNSKRHWRKFMARFKLLFVKSPPVSHSFLYWTSHAPLTCWFTQRRMPWFLPSGKIPILATLWIAKKSSFEALPHRYDTVMDSRIHVLVVHSLVSLRYSRFTKLTQWLPIGRLMNGNYKQYIFIRSTRGNRQLQKRWIIDTL